MCRLVWRAIIIVKELFFVGQRIWTELLSLLAGTLLVGSHLLLLLAILFSLLRWICSLHTRIVIMGSSLIGSHVENWRCLTRVIYDDVVYVIIVDDVSNVSTLTLSLSAFLRVSRRSSTSHAESLTIGISGAFKSTIIFTLLRHGIFS